MSQIDESRPFAMLLQTLKAGFDLTTKHWWLILFPLLLDGFLWLGPRLNLSDLGAVFLEDVRVFSAESDPPVPEQLMELLTQSIERSNLFSYLSAPFVGVPALMQGLSPEQVPTTPLVWQIPSIGWLVTGMIGLTILGLFWSTIYLSLMAQIVQSGKVDWGVFSKKLLPNTFKIIILFALFLLIFIFVALPILVVAVLLGMVSTVFVLAVPLASSFIFIWVLVYLSFSVQSLLTEDRSAWSALRRSASLVQNQMAQALPILLAVLVINNVINSLWLSADNGSWLTLINLAGHAFIATAVTVALFVFYRDRTAIHYVGAGT